MIAGFTGTLRRATYTCIGDAVRDVESMQDRKCGAGEFPAFVLVTTLVHRQRSRASLGCTVKPRGCRLQKILNFP